MKATFLYRHREEFDDGAILEVVMWRVHEAAMGSEHPYKYRLYYGYPGHRLVGYDNERGKGDHRHYHDEQGSYKFTTPEKLLDDFLADVARARR